MLIGAAPEALPMLMAEALPLSIENVPEVGPVTAAPRIESGPFTTVVVAARPIDTAPAFAVPMLIGAAPLLLPRLIADAFPLSIARAPADGPVIDAPRTVIVSPCVVLADASTFSLSTAVIRSRPRFAVQVASGFRY